MPFDEEELDPHGECRHEIDRLRTALREIVNYRAPVSFDAICVAMQGIAKRTLNQP